MSLSLNRIELLQRSNDSRSEEISDLTRRVDSRLQESAAALRKKEKLLVQFRKSAIAKRRELSPQSFARYLKQARKEKGELGKLSEKVGCLREQKEKLSKQQAFVGHKGSELKGKHDLVTGELRLEQEALDSEELLEQLVANRSQKSSTKQRLFPQFRVRKESLESRESAARFKEDRIEDSINIEKGEETEPREEFLEEAGLTTQVELGKDNSPYQESVPFGGEQEQPQQHQERFNSEPQYQETRRSPEVRSFEDLFQKVTHESEGEFHRLRFSYELPGGEILRLQLDRMEENKISLTLFASAEEQHAMPLLKSKLETLLSESGFQLQHLRLSVIKKGAQGA